MANPAKSQSAASSPNTQSAKWTARAADTSRKNAPTSKKSRIIAMLRSPDGVTIAAMMKATAWQQHSVRGFLAGIIRKRLKLRLEWRAVDGKRIYRIVGAPAKPAGIRKSKT